MRLVYLLTLLAVLGLAVAAATQDPVHETAVKPPYLTPEGHLDPKYNGTIEDPKPKPKPEADADADETDKPRKHHSKNKGKTHSPRKGQTILKPKPKTNKTQPVPNASS